MLTREHGIAELKGGIVHPDRLTRRKHSHYLEYADRMLAVYRKGVGKTRHQLHVEIRRIFEDEPDCPPKRIAAFCKLLDERSEYHTDKNGDAARLRIKVFQEAAPFHPLVGEPDKLFEHDVLAVRQRISEQLDQTWEDIDFRMFADVIEFHRLNSFRKEATPEDLLAHYNVAQIQVALYRATRMTIRATADFKVIVRHAKLCRLLHRISRSSDNRTYIIDLDGPASLTRETRRYGVNMAKLIPVLLACSGWSMEARIQVGRNGWKHTLRLTSEDGLTSHVEAPPAFDSGVEEQFFKKWGAEPREGWTLSREDRILHHQQKVFIPDFTLQHEDGRLVHLEIVGFWTPEYLAEKANTLPRFQDEPLLLAIHESRQQCLPHLPVPVITYKKGLHLKTVLEALRG